MQAPWGRPFCRVLDSSGLLSHGWTRNLLGCRKMDGRRTSMLRDQLVDHVAGHVCQAIIAPLVPVDEALMIDAELME